MSYIHDMHILNRDIYIYIIYIYTYCIIYSIFLAY